MQVQKAYKTELKPNCSQIELLSGHAGASRYAWNWALARVKDKTSRPNAMELHREWNEWKKQDDNCPWWMDFYESASLALNFVTDLLIDGTVIIFDDFNFFRGLPSLGEQGAFSDWLSRNPDISVKELCREGFSRIAFVTRNEIR